MKIRVCGKNISKDFQVNAYNQAVSFGASELSIEADGVAGICFENGFQFKLVDLDHLNDSNEFEDFN